MKILVDMNLSPTWVPFLADRGFEAVHWSTIGQPSVADEEVLGYAEANGFIVFTHDLDFGMLLAARKTRPERHPSPRSGRASIRHRRNGRPGH
jgi:predicted nuclease of predicted toxin-antitoxin system